MNVDIKKRILKYETLKCDFEEVQVQLKEYSENFNRDVCNNFSFENSKNSKKNSCNKKDPIPEPSDNFKKIYKKLSLKLHPDRNTNLEEEERKETEEIFKEVVDSYDNGDFCNLLTRAREFRVKIPQLNDIDIEILDKNINEIDSKIIKMKKDPAWLWYTTDNPRLKNKIKQMVKEIIEGRVAYDWVIDEEEDCAICLDKLIINKKEKRLLCGHIYHKDCILPWFQIKFNCPLCKMSFEDVV